MSLQTALYVEFSLHWSLKHRIDKLYITLHRLFNVEQLIVDEFHKVFMTVLVQFLVVNDKSDLIAWGETTHDNR